MFNWKNWQKSLASLIILVGVGVVTYGDFSTGQGVAPDINFKDLHTGEEVEVKEEERIEKEKAEEEARLAEEARIKDEEEARIKAEEEERIKVEVEKKK